MYTIAFYISDYGLGHATRSIAAIRAILSLHEDIRVLVRTGTASSLVRDSLPAERVTVVSGRNDVGVVFREGSAGVDPDATRAGVSAWISTWDRYIKEESASFSARGIDLVVSDIPPQPFLAAERAGIPSVAFSNFTWHSIFSRIPGMFEVSGILKEAYLSATRSLVLPFHDDNDIFPAPRRIGLVSRDVTVNPERLRERLGVGDDELLVFFNPGLYLPHLAPVSGSLPDHVRLLFPSHFPAGNALRIPADETETQNWVAACDLAVTKCGYSTISEAVRAKIPLFIFTRPGFYEDKLFSREITRMGTGKVVGAEDLVTGNWYEDSGIPDRYRAGYESLGEPYSRDGNAEVAGEIGRILGI